MTQRATRPACPAWQPREGCVHKKEFEALKQKVFQRNFAAQVPFHEPPLSDRRLPKSSFKTRSEAALETLSCASGEDSTASCCCPQGARVLSTTFNTLIFTCICVCGHREGTGPLCTHLSLSQRPHRADQLPRGP